MKFLFTSLLLCAGVVHLSAQAPSGYVLSQTFKIQSGGGWDYIAANDNRLYVSHGSQVNILDENSGDSLGVIPNTTGIHGIAFVPALGKGYTSNGRLNTVTVFDLKTSAVLKSIATGKNPDAIFYDPFSKRIITCNGSSGDLTVIDPVTETVTATIALGSKPETAVSDEAGKIFVNLEEKNEIAVVDIQSGKVIHNWSIAPAEGPTGLAIDLKTKRLFAGCEKTLVVMDYVTGKVTDKLTIADGCDGVAFDPEFKYVFASCGEGSLAIAQEDASGHCTLLAAVASKRSARTIGIDTSTHKVFLPAADLGQAAPGSRPPVIPGTFQVLVFSRP